MKVLLSIKPEFAFAIINGSKKFEYRKNIFKNQDISSVVIYATKPYGKILGEFYIDHILKATPEQLWRQTEKGAGIEHQYFSEYFKDKNYGFAIKIKRVIEYQTPIDLNDFAPTIKTPPQSFCYIN